MPDNLVKMLTKLANHSSKFSKNVAALNATYELQLQFGKRKSLENVNQFYGSLEDLIEKSDVMQILQTPKNIEKK
ncbi:MAG: hypothetical protein KatS3mg027_1602 [Bacteroidia bacterium]|nr:MAG: hypothetical protein KatS3mg027_1602 [Bacteroidia bacterium]